MIARDPSWYWMSGMLMLPMRARLVEVNRLTGWCKWSLGGEHVAGRIPPDAIPDFTDPATMECLIEIAREMRYDDSWRPYPLMHDSGVVEWVMDPPSRKAQTLYESEAAVVVAAIERGFQDE